MQGATQQHSSAISASDIQEMRDWIADCIWRDLDEEQVAELTQGEVIKGVERHYYGGVDAFLADGR